MSLQELNHQPQRQPAKKPDKDIFRRSHVSDFRDRLQLALAPLASKGSKMAAPSADSVTDWIARIKQGDPAAAQQLWQRYVEQLIALARHRLSGLPGKMADEHDAVQSAFCSFFRRAEAGQFPLLNDRQDLWQLLVVMSARKAQNLVRREFRQNRGNGGGGRSFGGGNRGGNRGGGGNRTPR